MARAFDDASAEYLEAGSAALTAAPMTMACWFNSDSAALNQRLFSLANETNGTDFYGLMAGGGVSGDIIRLSLQQGSGNASFVDTTTGYAINTWHHAAGSVDAAGNLKVWIDGGSKGTGSTAFTPTGLNRTRVGFLRAATPQYTSGLIGEVGLWNVALTDAEILALYRSSPLAVRPESLAAYWPLRLDEDKDWLGGFDLTANGTPQVGDHPPIMLPFRPRVVLAAATVVVPPSTAPSFVEMVDRDIIASQLDSESMIRSRANELVMIATAMTNEHLVGV